MKKNRLFLFPILLAIGFCCASVQAMAVSAKDKPTAKPPVVEQSIVNVPIDNSVEAALKAVYAGEFTQAEKIATHLDTNDANAAELKLAINDYTAIVQKRENLRIESLKARLDELAKLKTDAEVNEPNTLDIFSVAVKIRDLSAPADKDKITADKFIVSAVEKAIVRASEYEKQGQWMDSLLRCYSWLTILYEDNDSYEQHKEQLTEKIIIKSSLTDSPCEDTAQRYNGITEQMFIRSLEVLQYGYVSPFYYSDMLKASLKRYENLAEVLSMADKFKDEPVVSREVDSNDLIVPEEQEKGSFNIEFDKDQIPVFVSGIKKLQSQLGESPIGISQDQYIKMFKAVIELNSQTIALQKELVIAQFAEASLAELDPHTMLIWPKQTSDFQKSMTNEFTGVGIEISKADGQLRATSLLPGTPAYFSGLDAGDVIEAVDGEITRDMSINCAVSKITGPAGTKVVLTVRSQGQEKSRDIEITRARIIVPTIRGWSRSDQGDWKYIVDDHAKIGYVRLTSFSGNTTAEFKKVLKKIESDHLGALVLDLRYNSGGYLQTAAQIVDMFISSGIIVSSQPRFGVPTWEPAHKRGTHPDYPLVILINGGSASASEIVAGALADETHSRAILVGRQSYGKGSVQTITGYPGGKAQMKYTMAHYHLPNGDRVRSRFEMKKADRKDWGIMPDIEIKLNSEEIKKIFDIQRDNDVLVGTNHDSSKAEFKRHDVNETIEADIQLASAILVAKTKIIERKLK
ncbi:MAG: S41 family peptidase [Anaerohalosphaeraceae bacterium]|nr:S41 family peptidase [Anaerohalosphaeraceae bacterium]